MKNETSKYLWTHPKLFNETWNRPMWGYAIHDHNPNFYNEVGFFKLWEKCKEQEWWGRFKMEYAPSDDYFASDPHNEKIEGYIDTRLIDPLTFPDRVKEFLEGMK